MVWRWATVWMIGGSSSGMGWEFFCSLPGPAPIHCVLVLSPKVKRSGRELNTCFNLVPKLRMLENIPYLPQYIFIEWCLIKQWIRLHDMMLD
jgi:hypothetical protein